MRHLAVRFSVPQRLPATEGRALRASKAWCPVDPSHEDAFDQAERWLDLINYLHYHPGAKARELADRYQCTLRTIQRDVQNLRAIGVPIESARGYRMSCDAFLPPLNLSAEEMLAVLLGTRFVQRFGGEAVAQAAESAFMKICRRARPAQRRTARKLDERMAVETRASSSSGAEWLARLTEAIADKLLVKMRYHSLNAPSPDWRSVSPLSLFFFDNAWYLQAFDEKHKEERTFRLSRILELVVMQAPAVVAECEQQERPRHRWDFFGGEEVEVRLRVEPALRRWLMENSPHPSQQFEDGVAIYRVRDPLKMMLWTLSLEGAEVIEPEWVREAVQERARALCLLHGGVTAPARSSS